MFLTARRSLSVYLVSSLGKWKKTRPSLSFSIHKQGR